MKLQWAALGISVSVLVLSGTLSAGIIGTTGDIVVLDPPPADVRQDVYESNDHIYVWKEVEGLRLDGGKSVKVNASTPGYYNEMSDLSDSFITGDDVWVTSYFIHADYIGSPPPGTAGTWLSGSITFEEDILGLILVDVDIPLSHALLGAPGTTYDGGSKSGLELDTKPKWDRFTLSADMKTIDIEQFWVSTVRDTVRVVAFHVVPEPGTLVLIVSGGAFLLARKRRTR